MKWFVIKLKSADMYRCERAKNIQEACKLAFGVDYTGRNVAVYKVLSRKPSTLSAKVQQALFGPDGWTDF